MHDDAKRNAALAAIGELPEGGIVGLGTGSTIRFFIEALAELVKRGRRFEGVCTSDATRALASGLGIPLLPDEGPWTIDVAVDGADEVDDRLDLSKGAGGALTREKIVSFAAKRTVIVCDASKRVRMIGEKSPVAIEVLRFAHATTLRHLERLGRPHLRVAGGAPATTDGKNLLVDLAIEPTDDPASLDRAIRSIPGVVETGIFVGRADVVLVADDARVERLTAACAPRPRGSP